MGLDGMGWDGTGWDKLDVICAGPHLDGKSIHDILERFQVTGTAGVPTVYLGLLDHMDHMDHMDHLAISKQTKLPHLKVVIVGGAACPRKIFDAFDR